MDITSVPSLAGRKSAGLLVIPFWKGKKQAKIAVEAAALNKHFTGPISTQDFQGKEGEIVIVYVTGQPEKRFALLGLGVEEEITVEKFRRAYAHVTKICRKKKISDINVLLPKQRGISGQDLVYGIVEGILLSNYVFTSLQKDVIKDEPPVILSKMTLIGANKAELEVAHKCSIICDGVNLTRDLVNGNADDVTPHHLAAVARGLSKTCPHTTTTVFDKKRIVKEKMGLLLAVNRGSTSDPAFIIIEYKGNPKSKDKTVIVGKGITFDTGGLNLKSSGMETMKQDMAGAATVLGTIHAVASLGLKVNVTGVIPSTENSISSTSYKPGDVYVGYSGKTVENGNTDAEGRLVLADALAYTVDQLSPTRIIDFATLTGAIEITLGDEASGLFSNNDVLSDLLIRSGTITSERLWRLPLYPEYKEALKSDIADIKSTGGRGASSIKAAMFLQAFVGETPWAHLDIASTAFLTSEKRYQPKNATGMGVRLMVSLLENL